MTVRCGHTQHYVYYSIVTSRQSYKYCDNFVWNVLKVPMPVCLCLTVFMLLILEAYNLILCVIDRCFVMHDINGLEV